MNAPDSASTAHRAAAAPAAPAAPAPAAAEPAAPASGDLSVTLHRRVEWHDTDAAGHQHHSAILRWVESAEAELLRAHGLEWLFGRAPRVRHEVDYRARLWFGEEVTAHLRVERLGRTSLSYAFEVHGREGLAAEGRLVVVHAEPDAPSATPWPRQVREAFAAVAVGGS